MLEVVCAVIVRGGEILLCQRAPEAHLAGDWEFPGGKIEPGETAEEALRREIREELGCGVAVGKALQPVIHAYPEVEIRLLPFSCALVEGEPRALEHAAVEWVSVEGAAGRSLAEADRKVAVEVSERWSQGEGL